MMINKESLFHRSGKYGWKYPETHEFDDIELLGENFLNYIIIKIKVWSGKKNEKTVIVGIQMFFKSIIDGKILTSGIYKGTREVDKCDEFELNPDEYLSDFTCRVDNEIVNIGFYTNKGRHFAVGGDQGDEMITLVTSHGPAIVISLFGSYRAELETCGVVYMTRREYSGCLFTGFFELKHLLKRNETFKKKIMEIEDTLSYSDKVVFKVCQLPDTSFHEILRFCYI